MKCKMGRNSHKIGFHDRCDQIADMCRQIQEDCKKIDRICGQVQAACIVFVAILLPVFIITILNVLGYLE